MRKRENAIPTVNLKAGGPSADEAMIALHAAIAGALSAGEPAIKVIHGYGSVSGVCAIKNAVLGELEERKAGNQIVCYVRGENFETFDKTTQEICAVCPGIGKDCDYGRGNPGITVVLLRREPF